MDNQYVPALPFDGSYPETPFVSSAVLTPTVRPYCTSSEDAVRMKSIICSVTPLAINSPDFKPKRINDHIKTHLTDPKDAFRSWYSRLYPVFHEQWQRQGIDKAIFLATQPLYLHDKVLFAMTAFWNAQLGVFLLPTGPMGPTLMDVAMIAHLPVVGDDPVLGSLDGQEPAPDHEGWSLARIPERERGWTNFVLRFRGTEGSPVTALEHTAFLLFWLCRYVILSPSKSILTSQLDLAIHLATGRFFSLGTLFLANLYEELSRVSDRLVDTKRADTAASGPFWFLELWLRLYFPNAFCGRVPITPNPRRSLGLALAQLTPNSSTLSPSDCVIAAILTDDRTNSKFFVYELYVQYLTELFWPYSETNYPLSYPDPLPHPTYRHYWDSALKPRSLFSSPKFDKRNRKSFHTFNYQPQFLSRQFDCCQGLPGPLARPHLITQSPDGRVTPSLISPYLSQLISYISSNSYLPFRRDPKKVETFPSWWSDTWAVVAPPSDRLLAILTLPPALALGSRTPATVMRSKRAAPAEGPSAPRRKRATRPKATTRPVYDRQAVEDYLVSLPVDPIWMPANVRRYMESLAEKPADQTGEHGRDRSVDPACANVTDQPTTRPTMLASALPASLGSDSVSVPEATSFPTAARSGIPNELPVMRLDKDPTLRQMSSSTFSHSEREMPVGQSSVNPSAGPSVIRREEDPTVMVIGSSISTLPQPRVLPGLAAADSVVEPPITEQQRPVIPELVEPNAEPGPAILASVQADPEPVQADPEPVQADPVPVQHFEAVDVSSSESGDPSVNQSSEAVGSEPGFIGPLPAAAESVGHMRNLSGPAPLTPVLLTPSEATAVLHQATRELTFLSKVPLVESARPVVLRCVDVSLADLSSEDVNSLRQVVVDLLVQTPSEFVVAPILSRMME
ncbi:uncharacterized protein LOC127244312 [Andrographis paniculata]|uniref:uncharacterized protein LOC127244312 n=1 Tax=Andrographis paniculata TaxID=175694 RepID=UPI0021E6FDC3|nr:uncharacterized protein LOC127244312 [Andrographis paniculata]